MNKQEPVEITIETPDRSTLLLILQNAAGREEDRQEFPIEGHVDNILLTAVDKMLRRNTMDRFALRVVHVGAGIDKNSSLYRIVSAFASAIAAATAKGQ